MRRGVVVLTGPPGAGKTTVAVRVARRYAMAVHLHTDDFWHYIVAGAIPPYEPASRSQNETVMDVIAGAAFSYADGGFTTVVDGIVGPWMLDHFRKRARSQPQIPLHYMVLRPHRDVTLARAQGRTAPDALVDRHPILTMWDQFADLDDLEPHVLDTSDQDTPETEKRVMDAIASGHFRLAP
ncbi:ATP-binding protein [Actinomadura darangshiensis]|uniref:ATP-binding protein n=1 Tax=Actinomadura darangshiensis TaxID=705336 RepID=A0A4R4ZXB5_9ACTN|nr:AAA family ATPase [Actinomadura darangshiensis]TDD62789.1 ATP-binding protein [Actinomadura darangshiensis]